MGNYDKMASYTHNGKLWRNNENHGMTEVLAPFIIPTRIDVASEICVGEIVN